MLHYKVAVQSSETRVVNSERTFMVDQCACRLATVSESGYRPLRTRSLTTDQITRDIYKTDCTRITSINFYIWQCKDVFGINIKIYNMNVVILFLSMYLCPFDPWKVFLWKNINHPDIIFWNIYIMKSRPFTYIDTTLPMWMR